MRRMHFDGLPKLSIENFENVFNVYMTEDQKPFYNLIQGFEFPQNLPEAFFTKYSASYGDTWPLVSFKFFKTTCLWWIILAANNILNPTIQPIPGREYKIPIPDVVKAVFADLRNNL